MRGRGSQNAVPNPQAANTDHNYGEPSARVGAGGEQAPQARSSAR